MKKNPFIFTAMVVAVALHQGCKPDPNLTANPTPNLPSTEYAYGLKTPSSAGGTANSGLGNNNLGFAINSENPDITNAGATLGRVLFYDPQLSLNNTVSCASCHHQANGFADNKAQSVGFGGRVTPRNSMAIVNPMLNANLFWDSRSSSVKDLVSQPIQNHIEMGMEDLDALAQKLQKISYYPALIQKAYGHSEMNSFLIVDALSQFVCSISSSDSKFDHSVANNFSDYTALEKMGKDLFFSTKTKCSQCHSGANFAAPDFPGSGDAYSSPTIKGTANIGLDMVFADQGKGDGKFRIPSLRNVALTAPYMHDGRFNTLMDVVEHYNSGVKAHNQLDFKLRNSDGTPQRLQLNELEKRALVAFMNTLTDDVLIHDPKFSNPFK